MTVVEGTGMIARFFVKLELCIARSYARGDPSDLVRMKRC